MQASLDRAVFLLWLYLSTENPNKDKTYLLKQWNFHLLNDKFLLDILDIKYFGYVDWFKQVH